MSDLHNYSGAKLSSLVSPRLQRAIRAYPNGFFDTFGFVRTGNNLMHPLIVSEIAKIVGSLPKVHYVGIDVRLNAGKRIKFQPDIVAFDRKLGPLFFIDYESANSSDARIPIKDIAAYRQWRVSYPEAGPYLIVTTLPDGPVPTWELRWVGKGLYNEKYNGARGQIRANPFRFWKSVWQEQLLPEDTKRVSFLNIDRGRVRSVRLKGVVS